MLESPSHDEHMIVMGRNVSSDLKRSSQFFQSLTKVRSPPPPSQITTTYIVGLHHNNNTCVTIHFLVTDDLPQSHTLAFRLLPLSLFCCKTIDHMFTPKIFHTSSLIEIMPSFESHRLPRLTYPPRMLSPPSWTFTTCPLMKRKQGR